LSSQRTSHNAIAQIGKALAHNTALTSLSLTLITSPRLILDVEGLLEALTGLQSLSLERKGHTRHYNSSIPALTSIINMLSLTHLCIGPGFHLINLPQIVRHLTQLKVLHLRDVWEPEYRRLLSQSARQYLGLQNDTQCQKIPLLNCLTALQTLHVSECMHIRQIPSLPSLTALQALGLAELGIKQVPTLDTLCALQTLNLRSCLFLS
jgi:hypothetical protein